MGMFSSESRSRVSTASQSAGFSEVGGAAQSVNLNVGGKSRATVTALDGGAIGQAFGFAAGAQSAAFKQVELAGAQSAALVRESVAAVTESARGDAENVTITAIKWGAVAFAAWALMGALRRSAA